MNMRTVPQCCKNTESRNYNYQYDDLYRLIETTNGSNEAYTYDAVGNRITSANVTGQWNYNENNELIGYDGASYEYDNNGNIVSKTDQTGTTTFTYNVDNRLVQVRNPQSAIYNYYYNPFGKRLWKEVNGVKTYFFYSDEGLIGEYNASGVEIKTYGYAPSSTWMTNPLFQKIGLNYYWYENDHLGTPQKIIDSSGAVVWAATYDPFGKANVTSAAIENNLRFPGQYYDQETGLHYNLNRYYDPSTGRYLTPDPIGLEGGINLFVYAANNPVNLSDPTGQVGPIAIAIPVIGVVGAGEAALIAGGAALTICMLIPDCRKELEHFLKELCRVRCNIKPEPPHHKFGWPFNRRLCHIRITCWIRGGDKLFELQIPIPCLFVPGKGGGQK
jgi:RHS repeat-associated protein